MRHNLHLPHLILLHTQARILQHFINHFITVLSMILWKHSSACYVRRTSATVVSVNTDDAVAHVRDLAVTRDLDRVPSDGDLRYQLVSADRGAHRRKDELRDRRYHSESGVEHPSVDPAVEASRSAGNWRLLSRTRLAFKYVILIIYFY